MEKITKRISFKRQTRSGSQVRKFTRSKFGNFLFFAFLFAAGAFSVLPLVYCITTSLKPLDELMIFPPKLFTVARPTFRNYIELPDIISSLSIPLTRYVTNSIFVSVVGTVLHVFIAAMAAFVLSKTDFKHKKTTFIGSHKNIWITNPLSSFCIYKDSRALFFHILTPLQFRLQIRFLILKKLIKTGVPTIFSVLVCKSLIFS